MKKIINLPLNSSIALLLNDADINILEFGRLNNNKRIVVCDSCVAPINKGSYIYVPVLNSVLCQRCFDDWQKNGAWYEEDKNYQNKFNDEQKYKKDFSNSSPFSKDRDSIYEVKHYPKKHKVHNSIFDIPMADYEIDKERQRQKREMDKKRPKNKKYRIYEDY